LETSVSFANWVKNGWLVADKSSQQEIANLLGIVARDLKDSQAKDVSDDWRFAIAYNAALQAATAALAAAGATSHPVCQLVPGFPPRSDSAANKESGRF
jgi:hypothetical protein